MVNFLKISKNIKVGNYLHTDGTIDNNPSKSIVGVCVIPSNFLPDKYARFISFQQSRSIWGRDINVNKDYKKKLPGKKLEEFDWEFLDGPSLISPYLPNGSFNPDFHIDLPCGNAFQDYKGYENTEKYKKKYGNLGDLDNAFSSCSKISPQYRKSEWYLPSIGELALLFKKKSLINSAIKVGSTQDLLGNILSNYYYWSSSECDPEKAWDVSMGDNIIGSSYKDDYDDVCAFLAL